jgi:phenylacetate-coenzyme A ligase PaaK-like adenylate-forming protein
MVTSEMLFEDDKMLLEKQFGIPIVNEYGARNYLIASKCSRRMASKL